MGREIIASGGLFGFGPSTLPDDGRNTLPDIARRESEANREIHYISSHTSSEGAVSVNFLTVGLTGCARQGRSENPESIGISEIG